MSLTVADLHVGSAVYSREGEKVGRLRFMMVDPGSESVSHLVLEKGMLLHADVLASVMSVDKILYRGIFLNISSEEALNLPEFQEGRYLARERHQHRDHDDRQVPRHHAHETASNNGGGHRGGAGQGGRPRRFRRN